MADSRGEFSWYGVVTSDVEAARAFYTEVIGWTTQEWEGAMPSRRRPARP